MAKVAKVEAVAGEENNPFKHTVSVLTFLKSQTDTVILFYSGGKDSIVLLDLLHKHGFKVKLCFMYFVDGLYHVERYIDWAVLKYGVECKKYQHWAVSHYLKENYYRLHNSETYTLLRLTDIEDAAKDHFKCKWIVNGFKQADSLQRRLILRGKFMHSIDLKTHKCYPLSRWKKQNCLSYIKQNKLPSPVDYGLIGNSSGVDLDRGILLYLRDKHPEDFNKILKVFPLAEQLIYECK